MKRTVKRIGCFVLMFCVLSCFAGFSSSAKTSINTTSKRITAGKTFLLKIHNAGKNVQWSTSNKNIAKIKAVGGKHHVRARIKAVKKGTSTITAKIGDKKLKCKVTVKKKKNKSTGYTSKNKAYGYTGSTVYITETGEKYHCDGCRCLRSSKYSISLSKAKSAGYEPCGICHPPT